MAGKPHLLDSLDATVEDFQKRYSLIDICCFLEVLRMVLAWWATIRRRSILHAARTFVLPYNAQLTHSCILNHKLRKPPTVLCIRLTDIHCGSRIATCAGAPTSIFKTGHSWGSKRGPQSEKAAGTSAPPLTKTWMVRLAKLCRAL
jgi:hypothetical protein